MALKVQSRVRKKPKSGVYPPVKAFDAALGSTFMRPSDMANLPG